MHRQFTQFTFKVRILRWLYKQILKSIVPSNRKPVGLPLQRDPDAPCEFYEPIYPLFKKKKELGQWRFGDCQGDGHYLCKGCKHIEDKSEDEY